MKSYLTNTFTWKDMDADIQKFVSSCIWCAKTKRGERVPRTMGNLLHGEAPNELIHFDFLFIHEGSSPYVLVVRDDFTGFTILYRCETTSADTTADALAHWISLFGVPKIWHSDHQSGMIPRLISRTAS